MNRKKSRYEILSIHRVSVEVPARDLASRLDRVAGVLYPYLTSSANLHSSSLHLPETRNVGRQASEEVSKNAGNETNESAA